MNESVIEVKNLSKQYRIGEREPYKTIRETLVGAARAPFQKLSSFRSSQSTKTNPKSETIWALKDVSFEIERGEIVGIIGRNGAGKTTLLKILSRITEPTKGRVELRGRVGSLLEVGTGFHPELTGHENIYLYGAILGMDRYEVTRKFSEIVAFSELEKFVETPVKRYSSGMYMRLAFAVAAHMEPEILLVDEVLAVGDAAFQKRCLGKMEDVAKGGRTVMFVSHNMASISSLCSTGLFLEEGAVSLKGDIDSVVKAYLSTLDEATGKPLLKRKDRRGSGAFRFTNVKISGAKDSDSVIVCGQPAFFTIEYSSECEKPLSKVELAAIVRDSYGNLLFTCLTNHQGTYLAELAPTSQIVCHIHSLPLLPGVYQIDLWGSTQGEEADYITSAEKLVVMEGDFFGTGKLPIPTKHGPFLVGHSWEAL